MKSAVRSIWTSKASRAATYLCHAISKLTLTMLLGTVGPEGPTSAAVNKFSGGGGTRRPAIAERRFPEQRSKALMKRVLSPRGCACYQCCHRSTLERLDRPP